MASVVLRLCWTHSSDRSLGRAHNAESAHLACSQCFQGTVNSVKMACRFHVPLAVVAAKDRSTSVAPLLAVQDHVMTGLRHLRPRGGWSNRQLACVPGSMGASLWRLCSCSQPPPVPLPAMQVCVVLLTGPGESPALYEATQFLPCFSFVLWEELSPQSQPFKQMTAGGRMLGGPARLTPSLMVWLQSTCCIRETPIRKPVKQMCCVDGPTCSFCQTPTKQTPLFVQRQGSMAELSQVTSTW